MKILIFSCPPGIFKCSCTPLHVPVSATAFPYNTNTIKAAWSVGGAELLLMATAAVQTRIQVQKSQNRVLERIRKRSGLIYTKTRQL